MVGRPNYLFGLETRGVRPEAGSRRRPIGGGLETRGARPAPGSRVRPQSSYPRGGRNVGATVFGDMGMGIPSNAARGGPNIPMLERGFARPLPPPPGPITTPPPPPTGGTGGSPNPIKSGGKSSGIRNMMKSKNFKRNALIGAGVVAAASVVQSRRGDGTSRGRQSNYRY